MPFTFIVLGLAIVAVWLPPIRLHDRVTLAPWVILLCAAMVSGAVNGLLATPASIAIAVFGAATWSSLHVRHRWAAGLWMCVCLAMALALALHLLPGFRQPTLYDGVRLSAESIPFTQYLNFDKGVAGLFLLAAFCARVSRLSELKDAFKPPVCAIVLGTPAVVIGAAWACGAVRFDPKLPPLALAFLGANLLLTCVAEEAFFRGVVQERLTRFVGDRQRLRGLPVAVSALLFAIAHVGAGMPYMVLVTLAGLGYSMAYAFSRRIEAAILTHFMLNAAHFLFFSYPVLR